MSSNSDGTSGAGDITTKQYDKLRVITGGACGKPMKPGHQQAAQPDNQVVLIYSADRKQPLKKQFYDLPINKKKVEDLKRRLADGSLRINADKIADKLIEKDLLNG